MCCILFYFFISLILIKENTKQRISIYQTQRNVYTKYRNLNFFSLIKIYLKIAQRCLITNIPKAVIIISITEIAVIKYAEINKIISNKLKTYQIVFEHNVQSQ